MGFGVQTLHFLTSNGNCSLGLLLRMRAGISGLPYQNHFPTCQQNMKVKRVKVSLPEAGLEPAIAYLGGKRRIHWATRATVAMGGSSFDISTFVASRNCPELFSMKASLALRTLLFFSAFYQGIQE